MDDRAGKTRAVTRFAEQNDVRAALAAGAPALVLKDADEITNAIRAAPESSS